MKDPRPSDVTLRVVTDSSTAWLPLFLTIVLSFLIRAFLQDFWPLLAVIPFLVYEFTMHGILFYKILRFRKQFPGVKIAAHLSLTKVTVGALDT